MQVEALKRYRTGGEPCCRVSTLGQTVENQIREIEAARRRDNEFYAGDNQEYWPERRN